MVFEPDAAMIVRRTIEESREGKDKRSTRTYELIKWAHFLGALDDDEFSDLVDFNKKRNHIMHSHGQWLYAQKYGEALRKAIRFLQKNSLWPRADMSNRREKSRLYVRPFACTCRWRPAKRRSSSIGFSSPVSGST